MPSLKFSTCPIEPYKGKTWDKITNRKTDDTFHTIRKYTDDKLAYYTSLIGDDIHIFQYNKWLGKAKIYDVKEIVFPDIDIIRNDTFKDADEIFFKKLMTRFYGEEMPRMLIIHMRWLGVSTL